MTKRELVRAVQNEVKEGKDRKMVFDTYLPQFPKPLQLATTIAGIVREEAKQKCRSLNLLLVVLLVFAGLLKLVGIWFTLAGTNIALAAGVGLVGLIVPWAFAYEINRFTGAMYGLLTILCGVGMLNVLARFETEGVIGTVIDLSLLGGIMTLSIILRKKLFPGLKLLGAKTDGNGAYVLG